MKKGFTLIELLAVIIILAVIALIATPIVLNVVNDAKESARKSSVAGYADAMKLGVSDYMFTNKGELPIIDKDFQKKYNSKGENVICEGVYSTDSYGIVLHNCKVGNESKLYCFAKGNHYTCDDATYIGILEYAKSGQKPNISYKDNSGANIPELLDNMIPVKYETNHWIYADISQEWYNYDKKEWANAVILKKDSRVYQVGEAISIDDIAQMYVWIPRYKYIVFNGNYDASNEQEIKIKFESGIENTGTVHCEDAINQKLNGEREISQICTDSTNKKIINGTSTYTHPAFTFGSKQLTGFWMGKFENSGTIDNITIIPNVNSLNDLSISQFFEASQNIKTNYRITNGDSHMIKNSEWGSVAFLSHSQYGRCTDGVCEEITINNVSFKTTIWETRTGCAGSSISANVSTTCENLYDTEKGGKASTTGNIYGIYDMSGGLQEYVMGNMVDSIGDFYPVKSNFINIPDSKYYDKYSYGSSSYGRLGRGRLGDAIEENQVTPGAAVGWYHDSSLFIAGDYSWLVRGGYSSGNTNAGIFNSNVSQGEAKGDISSRSILVLD